MHCGSDPGAASAAAAAAHQQQQQQQAAAAAAAAQQQNQNTAAVAAAAAAAAAANKDAANVGYLLLVNRDLMSDSPDWTGETVRVKPTAETTITLSQIEVTKLAVSSSEAEGSKNCSHR